MTELAAKATTKVTMDTQVLRLSKMAPRDRDNLLAEMAAFGESLADGRIDWDQAWREVLMAGARHNVNVEHPGPRWRRYPRRKRR